MVIDGLIVLGLLLEFKTNELGDLSLQGELVEGWIREGAEFLIDL